MPAISAMPRPRSWATSSSSTCSRKRPPAGDAEGGGGARRRARQALLPGLINANPRGVRFAGRRRLFLPRGIRHGSHGRVRCRAGQAQPACWTRAFESRNWLGAMFMVPAIAILHPVSGLSAGAGLLARHDRHHDRRRRALSSASRTSSRSPRTSVFWLSVFNTIFYTVVASIVKFAHRPLSRAAAQRAAAVQVADPRHRAVALRGADGAVGDRVLVDL